MVCHQSHICLLFLSLGFALCYVPEKSPQSEVSEGRSFFVYQSVKNSTDNPVNVKVITVKRKKHNKYRLPRPTPKRHRPSYQRPPAVLYEIPPGVYSRPQPQHSYLPPPWWLPYPAELYPLPPYMPPFTWMPAGPRPLPGPASSPAPEPLPSPSPSLSPSPSTSQSPSTSPTPSPSPSPSSSSPPSSSPEPSPGPSSSPLSDAFSESIHSSTSSPSPSSSTSITTRPALSPALSKIPQPAVSTSLIELHPPYKSPTAGVDASISSPLVTKGDFCEVVVFLCNLKGNPDVPEPPAQFCELFNPSCAASNLVSTPTQALTWLCEMFPSHWMCNAPVKTPTTFCNQFTSHWTCLTKEEFSDFNVLFEHTPERPKQVKWFCQNFPNDWMCEDPVVPPSGFCEKFTTHWACAAQAEFMDDDTLPPAGLETFCNLVPSYWMCESPLQPPLGFCETYPRNWACQAQIANVAMQPPLCEYFPWICENPNIDKHQLDHSLPIDVLLKYSALKVPQSGSIRVPSELLKVKRRKTALQSFTKSVRVARPNRSVYKSPLLDNKKRIADLNWLE